METSLACYIASSWRNRFYPNVITDLRQSGLPLDVYDFKNPVPGDEGFHWSEIDPNYGKWTKEQFVEALSSPVAEKGFGHDMAALKGCDACILVLPSGRSAHLEAGYATGAGKPTIVYIPPAATMEELEIELMYKMHKNIVLDWKGVLAFLDDLLKSRERLETYYFGCVERTGHYFWDKYGRSTNHLIERKILEIWPQHVDGTLCPQSTRNQGLAKVHHKNGWSALSFWDYSVDMRGGSNSNFFIHLPELSFEEMVRLAKRTWPQIWSRFQFEVVETKEP